jgi:hypothetical protein
MKLTIGADPEVFAKKDGEYISAHGLVPGTKENPFPVQNGAVQVDGMALEFNIDPAGTEQVFCHNVATVMKQLKDMAGVELAADPVATFDQEYFDSQPEEAKDRGCDPDFNAWTGRQNDKPDSDLPIWTGAGHVHIGFLDEVPDNHHAICCAFGQQLDFYLGLPSLAYDTEVQRRSLYGAAGAFRPKPYGLEYRVLSNAWVSTEELTRWVFRNTVKAFESMQNPLVAKYGDIQNVINNSWTETARQICTAEGIEVPGGFAHVG